MYKPLSDQSTITGWHAVRCHIIDLRDTYGNCKPLPTPTTIRTWSANLQYSKHNLCITCARPYCIDLIGAPHVNVESQSPPSYHHWKLTCTSALPCRSSCSPPTSYRMPLLIIHPLIHNTCIFLWIYSRLAHRNTRHLVLCLASNMSSTRFTGIPWNTIRSKANIANEHLNASFLSIIVFQLNGSNHVSNVSSNSVIEFVTSPSTELSSALLVHHAHRLRAIAQAIFWFCMCLSRPLTAPPSRHLLLVVQSLLCFFGDHSTSPLACTASQLLYHDASVEHHYRLYIATFTAQCQQLLRFSSWWFCWTPSLTWHYNFLLVSFCIYHLWLRLSLSTFNIHPWLSLSSSWAITHYLVNTR